MQVGILGVGSFLPDHVRTNDWWPAEHVAAWREKRVNRMTRGAIPKDVLATEGVLLVAREMDRLAHDPFDGGLQRRVIADDMSSGDMEVMAAQHAMTHAGVGPSDIDVLFVQSMCPDHATANNAAAVHERLGLRQRVLSLETQGVCNAFLLQLQVAEQMVKSGASKCVLVVQSSPLSRLMDPRDPFSVWFGDGATAVVLGPVSEGRGLLGMSTRTDGTCARALLGAVSDELPWYADGPVRIHAPEPLVGRRMLLSSAELGKQVLDEVLAETGTDRSQIDFFACHQASSWFRSAAQSYLGIQHARVADTYVWAGNLTGANLPLVLEVGLKERSLKDGDLVAMYAGGGGMTWSAALLRWGR